MKYKNFFRALFFTVLNVSVVTSMAQSAAPTQPVMSICEQTAQTYSMINGQETNLNTIKQYLFAISKLATLTPEAIVQQVMALKSVDSIVFYCQDQATVGDFSAAISFSYQKDGAMMRTQYIMIHMVPPDGTPPTPLAEPKVDWPKVQVPANVKVPTAATTSPDTTQ